MFPGIGLGLFAGEDIIVPNNCSEDDLPELFPFSGPKYTIKDWVCISRQCPTYTYYGMRLDVMRPFSMMDGYPPRTGNIAGYVNSVFQLQPPIKPNVEWVECVKQPKHPRMAGSIHNYVMTYAIQTIRAGDEILADYDPRRYRDRNR